MRDHPNGEGPATKPALPIWTGRATNRAQWLLATAGVACLAFGIVLAVDASWTNVPLVMSIVGCLAVGVLMLFGTLAFVHVAVKVYSDAVEVRCGHLGLPRRRIRLDHVAGAEFAPSLTPRHWGGWGYRWRPDLGVGMIVREGEGVILKLGDGGTFSVTVDDAQTAVRVIRGRLGLGTTGKAAGA